jgi:ABC-2 type transport system ATP-binding protein
MDEAEHCDRIAIIDGGRIVAMGTPETLKEQVGLDRVVLRAPDQDQVTSALRDRFGLDPIISEGAVAIHVANGAEFVPRLFGELGVPVSSVSVARPTLDDVFMTFTGRTIRDAEASTSEVNATRPWMRAMRSR